MQNPDGWGAFPCQNGFFPAVYVKTMYTYRQLTKYIGDMLKSGECYSQQEEIRPAMVFPVFLLPNFSKY